jgi:hypothetical protein
MNEFNRLIDENTKLIDDEQPLDVINNLYESCPYRKDTGADSAWYKINNLDETYNMFFTSTFTKLISECMLVIGVSENGKMCPIAYDNKKIRRMMEMTVHSLQ